LCLFIYLYLFSETRAQVRPVYGFLRAIAQRRKITQRCAFWGLNDVHLNFWGKIPKN